MDERAGDGGGPGADAEAVRGFLVHCFHRQKAAGVVVYGIGRLETGETFGLVLGRRQPFFFVRNSSATAVLELAAPRGVRLEATSLRTMDGEGVTRVIGNRLRPLQALSDDLSRAEIRTYEADVSHVVHVLADLGVTGPVRLSGDWRRGKRVGRVAVDPVVEPSDWDPELSVLVLDIETDVATEAVLAVSLVATGARPHQVTEEVHLVGDVPAVSGLAVTGHASEAALLSAVSARISRLDPDVLTGWNVIDFDLAVLSRRFAFHGLAFNLGRTRDASWVRTGEGWGRSRATVYGRQVVDSLHLARVHVRGLDEYRLGTVAQTVLGRTKTLADTEGSDRGEEVRRLYSQDPAALCEYCLEDSRLVRDILAKEGLLRLTLQRALLTGLPLSRAEGSVAAFDHLYLCELRRRGHVAPTCGVDRSGTCGSPGGLVMVPVTGLHRHVFAFDFKSLYPSIIRTFNIDPLAHVRGEQMRAAEAGEGECVAGGGCAVVEAPNGAVFDRDPGILPSMLQRFFARRDQAKAERDEIASYAYKILMNSFYGVLGAASCRFADPELASAITGFGQTILRWCRALLEERGYRVLYGDTDSLFVDMGLPDPTPVDAAWRQGRGLCDWVNRRLTAHVAEAYGVASFLELELDAYYRRFLLPSLRGDSDRGRAKGYAGLRADGDGSERVEIVGMEAVRSDWTDLAHGLQRECLALLFGDCSVAELAACVRTWVASVRKGERDEQLVYRRRLRKPVDAYTRTTPPHVKAAKLLASPAGMIRYVMTVAGPQPVGHVRSALDYGHYIERQVRPIVTTIGQVCGLDVGACVSGERSLFGDQ